MFESKKVVVWEHEGTCDGCGRTYKGAEPPVAWVETVAKFLSGEPATTTLHFCRICREAMGIAIDSTRREREQEDAHPLADWERELLALDDLEAPLAVDGEALLDRLADILYPMDEYRDSTWNGGDVCEAVANILREYRPEAATRQPVWKSAGEVLGDALIAAAKAQEPLATDVEPAHKHEWRWSNHLFADAVTRRYCVDCGVLFTDL